VGVAVLLSGCGAAEQRATTTSTAPASALATTSTPSTEVDGSAEKVSGPAWSHVHNLVYDGEALLLGTHEGLYRHDADQPPQLLSNTAFDVMGLTHDGSRWLASGHPGDGERLPADIGLRASTDGRAWTTVSLLGEVDFHRLTAAGTTVLGVSAHDGAVLRSTDRGASWTRLDNPGVFDLALDPGNPSLALATTRSGPLASADGGSTWWRSSPGPRTGCTGLPRTARCTSPATAVPPGSDGAVSVGSLGRWPRTRSAWPCWWADRSWSPSTADSPSDPA
jgi:hypothetical protein